MKIILLGYMASGKSTIGKLLAEKLNITFIDLDSYIEVNEKKVISKIFKEKGEIYFRKIEHNCLSKLLQSKDNFVLSLGGGTPSYYDNIKMILDSDCKVIYLKASISTLLKRIIKNKVNRRPLVANIKDEHLPEFIGKHLFERSVDYEKAHIKISVDNKLQNEIITDILSSLH